MEAVLNILFPAQDQDPGFGRQGHIRFQRCLHLTITAQTEDIELKSAADIDLAQGLPSPEGRDVHFVDRIAVGEVDVVVDVVGTAADGGPDRQLLLREDDFVGAVAQQELLL